MKTMHKRTNYKGENKNTFEGFINVYRFETPEEFVERMETEPLENPYLENYENLANAIILRAVLDYKDLYRKCKKHEKNPESETYKTAKSKLDHIEKFFYSDYFKLLTDADGDYIVRKMKEDYSYISKRWSASLIPTGQARGVV